jgi:hypothetical protein
VSSHTGEWTLNASTHALDWSVPLVNSDESSGSLEFSVSGDDAAAFFPVKVSFIGEGSMAGISVANVIAVEGGEAIVFSQDSTVTTDEYIVE